jgi:hypothetical protein
MRPVVRALQNAGAIEAKSDGYPGKLIGRYYGVTPPAVTRWPHTRPAVGEPFEDVGI